MQTLTLSTQVSQVGKLAERYPLPKSQISGKGLAIAPAGSKSRQTNQPNLWIARPERSFGSNHVVLGGMMLPLSAMSVSCFMETG